jgi:C4-dicarboxylate-specific signal transduction histidine kinase
MRMKQWLAAAGVGLVALCPGVREVRAESADDLQQRVEALEASARERTDALYLLIKQHQAERAEKQREEAEKRRADEEGMRLAL